VQFDVGISVSITPSHLLIVAKDNQFPRPTAEDASCAVSALSVGAMDFSLDAVAKTLQDNDENWKPRMKALVTLEGYITDHAGDSSILDKDFFRALRMPLKQQLLDLRSSIVREACKALTSIADSGGDHAEIIVSFCLPSVMEVSAGANKVMSTYARTCLWSVLTTCEAHGAVNYLVEAACTNKNKGIRENSLEGLRIILRNWPNLTEADGENIYKAFVAGFADASAKARKHTREAVWDLNEYFPDLGTRIMAQMEPRTKSMVMSLHDSFSPSSEFIAKPGKKASSPSKPSSPTKATNMSVVASILSPLSETNTTSPTKKEPAPPFSRASAPFTLVGDEEGAAVGTPSGEETATVLPGAMADEGKATALEIEMDPAVVASTHTVEVKSELANVRNGPTEEQPIPPAPAAKPGTELQKLPTQAIGEHLRERHRAHIDSVLEILRKEMEMLAEFEHLGRVQPSDVAKYASNIADAMHDRENLLAVLYHDLGETCTALR
jgi:hypothetical protein